MPARLLYAGEEGVTAELVLGGLAIILMSMLAWGAYKFGKAVEQKEITEHVAEKAETANEIGAEVSRGPVGAAADRLRREFGQSVPSTDDKTRRKGDRGA